jgi:putative endopeptidase
LTIGENIGDLGGLSIAHLAYTLARGDGPVPATEGYTDEQRFFLRWAAIWQRKLRRENALQRLSTDPHAPNEFRCNQIVRNVTSFYEAFDVRPSHRLWLPPEDRVSIW